MPPVILPYTYILPDWLEITNIQPRPEDPPIFLLPFVVRSEPQSRREDAILVVTNHTTQDLYIRVSLFDMDGNEMRRGPLAGVGAGNLFPDFGFPLSATVRPLNQVRLVMDPIGSGNQRFKFGWGRIHTSFPVALSAYVWNVLPHGTELRTIPVVPAESLVPGNSGSGPAHPEPPPARPGTVGPPPTGVPGAPLPAVVLDAAPPVIDASAHFKTWEDRVRADAESVQAARRVREPLFKRLLRAFLDR